MALKLQVKGSAATTYNIHMWPGSAAMCEHLEHTHVALKMSGGECNDTTYNIHMWHRGVHLKMSGGECNDTTLWHRGVH